MSESFRVIEFWAKGHCEVFYFLILTDRSDFKYLVSVTPPVQDAVILPNHSHLAFDTVPLGDWNIGYLHHTKDGYTLGSQEYLERPAVGPLWYPVTIDILDLPGLIPEHKPEEEEELAYITKPHRVTMALPQQVGIDSDKGVAIWTWDGHLHWFISHECTIHGLLQGHGVTPRFLAHITADRSRTIGFILEEAKGRLATSADFETCRDALSKMHRLGLVHGSLRSDTFLITDKGTALIQNLRLTRKAANQETFDEEMASLEKALKGGMDAQCDAGNRARADKELHAYGEYLDMDGRH
jgi:hypothetical protein